MILLCFLELTSLCSFLNRYCNPLFCMFSELFVCYLYAMY
nr:MAG TPA: hypothetical protein [Caudoviricetes sp.]